jgi:RNA polymerase sigma-70 factor (ECF subfamily)
LSEADRKENRFQKQNPVNITEEKHKSLEPQIQFLYKCIAELPETDRIIISLELEEVKQAEIAKIVSEANIRVKFIELKKNYKFKEKE